MWIGTWHPSILTGEPRGECGAAFEPCKFYHLRALDLGPLLSLVHRFYLQLGRSLRAPNNYVVSISGNESG